MKYSKWWKERNYNQDYLTQQVNDLKTEEEIEFPRQEEAKGVNYQQTRITKNVKRFFFKKKKK